MGINSTEVSYQFGQLGSVFTKAGSSNIKPPTGKVFIAITMLADTTFESHGGLVAQQDSRSGLEYISTEDASGTAQTAHAASDGSETTSTGSGGLVVDSSNTFPKGTTIYGRWTEFKPSAAGVICYFGK